MFYPNDFYYLIILASAYLIGSIPFSFISLKTIKNQDIRKVGDKNVGAGNAFRSSKSFFVGFIAISGDIAKGSMAFLLTDFLISTQVLSEQLALSLAAFALIIGHNYPIFLKFHGGKGFATSLGFYINLNILATISQFVFYKSFYESTKNIIKSPHQSYFILIISIIFTLILAYLTTPNLTLPFVAGFTALMIKQTREHYFKN